MRFSALVILAIPSFLPAQDPTDTPFLWRIETPKPSYLYGTIHTEDQFVVALPATVRWGIRTVDAVYNELPKIDEKAAPKALAKSLLPDDQTLEDVLPESLWRRFTTLCEKQKIPLALFKKFRPWALSVQLDSLAEKPPVYANSDLDSFVRAIGEMHGKEIGGLERIEEQTNPFDALTKKEQITMLERSIARAEKRAEQAKAGEPSRVLIDLYLSGDEQRMLDYLGFELGSDEANRKLYHSSVTVRNERMTNRIVGHMQKRPAKTFFFAVGVGHMVGEGGIVARLRKRGYRITRLGGELSPETQAARKKALEERAKELRAELDRTLEAIETPLKLDLQTGVRKKRRR